MIPISTYPVAAELPVPVHVVSRLEADSLLEIMLPLATGWELVMYATVPELPADVK